MYKKKIAIIGGGIGSLSAALYLSNANFDVYIFEKNEKLGGKAYELKINNFRFDQGPSLLTMPFVLENIFSENNFQLKDFLSLKKLNVICKYFYPDGKIFVAYSDIEKLAEEIQNLFNEKKETIYKYLNYSRSIYDLTSDLFLFQSFELKNLLNFKALKTLLQFNKIDAFRTMHQANSSFFKDKNLIQLFDRYATYNGSNPYKAPATLNIIQHVEYNLGAYFPEDGIYSIVKSFEEALRKTNTKIYLNSEVSRIILNDKKAIGLIANNEKNFFDAIISNADVDFTFSKLLDNYNCRESKIQKRMEKSTSAIVFYLGVEGIRDELEVHNIFFSENYEKEFSDLFNKKFIPDDPTIYLYISSKIEKNDAPDGWENWFLMINAPSNLSLTKVELENLKEKLLLKVFNYLNIKNKPKAFLFDALDPITIEKRTNSIGGSLYGISSNNRCAAFLRQKNKSRCIKNLYFASGSAHPGGGIPLVALSGKIAAKEIIKDLSK